MKEQTYIIKKGESFELKHIFDCGQCFRWNEEPNGSYTGVIKNGVLNVKEDNGRIIFTGMLDDDIEKVCKYYFDLDTNYEKIKQILSKIDNDLKNSIQYGNGIRILKQDLWETIISFIISANNNIPRIKGIIERICAKYGKEIKWNGKNYYTFPTPYELKIASIEDLRSLGAGFRDKYIYKTTQMILAEEVNIEELKNEKDINKIKQELLRFPGIGDKVADCIMLFSLNKFEVFPIDVWVRRVMNELYIKEDDEKKVNKELIQKIAKEKYDKLAGIAQQYLFYWKREA